MKKLFLFFALLASIAVMTGCKKDQDFVTLKAVIDPDTKAYFGTAVRPYWNADDQVRVMGGGYRAPLDCDLSDVSETYATIVDVDNSTNGYYAAIFPLDAAEKMFVPETTGTAHAVIYYRPDQVYHEVTVNDQTKQQVNMIMGAVTDDNTKTFYFKNLCSILRLNITNDYGQGIKVSRVTIQASGAYVAGSADVTLTPNGTPQVAMDGLHEQADNVLSLYPDPEGNVRYIKTLAANGTGSTATIDVVVPPFDASELNIELELYDENDNFLGNSDAIISNPPALALNKIVPIDLTTNHGFEIADYAYIEPGPAFHAHMLALQDSINRLGGIINSMAFNVNEGYDVHPYESSLQVPTTVKVVNLKDYNSPFNIWAYLVKTYTNHYTINIVCEVGLVYANKNCSQMFQGLSNLETMNWNNGDLPGFQTEDVVDMSYMFAGCSSLTSIQGANFNTTNVRTMAHMFDGCSSCTSFESLGTTNFNTHNLQDMEAMFKDCAALTSIDLSNFNTNRVSKMKELFRGCKAAQTITLSSDFTTPQVTDMSYMFSGCEALTGIDLSSFTTNQVTTMMDMFSDCKKLRNMNLSSFTISSGTNLTNMFHNLNSSGNNFDVGNMCAIYCDDNCYNALHATGANTGIDESKVYWPNHTTTNK
jgi:surface protein